MGVSRVLGLLAPIALPALGLWLIQEIDTPEGAAIGMFAVGIVTGLLLRAWWAAAYAPGIIVAIFMAITLLLWPINALFDIGSDQPASADRTPWIVSVLIAVIWGLLPLAAGALFGTAIGKLIENRPHRTVARERS